MPFLSTLSWFVFLAANSQHTGDWLFALPIASFGLKLNDETMGGAAGTAGTAVAVPLLREVRQNKVLPCRIRPIV